MTPPNGPTTESTSASPRVRRNGESAPVEESRSYYGRGIINKPVWTWEIPVYFFAGGLAGASSILAAVARMNGEHGLARTARRIAAAGALASPPLLISDLGRPERFHHMLRVFKPTSPMSMGSWLLAAFAPLQTASTVLAELGSLPRLQRLTETAAATLAPAMTTYTAVLVSDTAVPVWHEARKELPWLFAAGAVASAGSACMLVAPSEDAPAARRLAMVGGISELVLTQTMERRLGQLAGPYEHGPGKRWSKAGTALTLLGTSLLSMSGRLSRRRTAATAGALALFAGAMSERWAVFRAGEDSADDPRYTVDLQRQRTSESRP